MTLAERKQELPWHLRGNWAPVHDELTVEDLQVEGRIPRELNGLYLRNGMNPRSRFDPAAGTVKEEQNSGARERHDLGKDVRGGEPVFAPRAADAAEDDGWILSIVHNEREAQSSLVILDARDIAAAPAAKVELPRRVPSGAHGNWLPDL